MFSTQSVNCIPICQYHYLLLNWKSLKLAYQVKVELYQRIPGKLPWIYVRYLSQTELDPVVRENYRFPQQIEKDLPTVRSCAK